MNIAIIIGFVVVLLVGLVLGAVHFGRNIGSVSLKAKFSPLVLLEFNVARADDQLEKKKLKRPPPRP